MRYGKVLYSFELNIFVNPSFLACLTLFSKNGVDLNSPKRPTSEIAIDLAKGIFLKLEKIARQIAKSDDVSDNFSPPATFTKTSIESKGSLQCFCKTARRSSSRPLSIPFATRLGIGSLENTVKACISTIKALVPSIVTVSTDPGVSRFFDPKKVA